MDKRLLQARGHSDNNLFGGDDINPHPMAHSLLRDARGFGLTVIHGGRPTWVSVFWGGEIGENDAVIRGQHASEIREWLAPYAGQELIALDLSSVVLSLRDPASLLVAFTVLLDAQRETFSGDLPDGSSWSWLPPDCVFG